MGRTIVLNDTSFNDNIKKISGLAVVFFWTLWCGHCSPVMRIFTELSEEMPDAAFVMVNKDEGEETAKQFEILSVPFLLFMKNGKVIKRHLGGIEKEQLKSIINSIK